MHTTLVLGGYGFFGARISAVLAKSGDIHLLIGGRDGARARACANSLGLTSRQGVSIDTTAPNLAQRLASMGVNTIIHTAGPFQDQDYSVAKAAIAANSNYVDLADSRSFVAGIRELDAVAREHGVTVTSGASSLPALSSAVVDRYASQFAQLESIRIGIGSGARAPGLATMRGVFSYCGKPFTRLQDGAWVTTHGWQDTKCHNFPAPVGRRLLGSCDVPDLELFPQRYGGVRTVTFHAGFASAPGHLVVWAGAVGVRLGLIRSLVPAAKQLHEIAKLLEPVTSEKGGMFVSLQGIGIDGRPLKLDWHLIAERNHGPHIPCGGAIAMAQKFARDTSLPVGALPCMGLLDVDEYLAPLRDLAITELRP